MFFQVLTVELVNEKEFLKTPYIWDQVVSWCHLLVVVMFKLWIWKIVYHPLGSNYNKEYFSLGFSAWGEWVCVCIGNRFLLKMSSFWKVSLITWHSRVKRQKFVWVITSFCVSGRMKTKEIQCLCWSSDSPVLFCYKPEERSLTWRGRAGWGDIKEGLGGEREKVESKFMY